LLLSMTGFGEEHRQQGGVAVSVEVRTVNSRYLKLSIRASEGYAPLEPKIEAVVRKRVRRGTVQVNLRVDRAKSPDDYAIDVDVLELYRDQLEALRNKWNLSRPVSLEAMLGLPGVVRDESSAPVDAAADWPLVGRALESALDRLHQMRLDEGRAMAADLKANCRILADSLEQVALRAPLVVDAYSRRLEERLTKTLAELDVALHPGDVLKEVGFFADRVDIAEEIVRLRSHVEQFEAIMDAPESSGRKLDFLTQEMVREGNTIGSKANDVEISRHVIEIKTAIERIREMIQNVE